MKYFFPKFLKVTLALVIIVSAFSVYKSLTRKPETLICLNGMHQEIINNEVVRVEFRDGYVEFYIGPSRYVVNMSNVSVCKLGPSSR